MKTNRNQICCTFYRIIADIVCSMFAKKGTNEGEKAAQIGSTVHIASSIDLQLTFWQHDIMTVVRKHLSCRAGHFDAHSPM